MIRTFFTLVFLSLSLSALAQDKIVLVIDPGHGGNDPGHLPNDTTTSLTEKELNLKVAKFLGGYIEKYLENVDVVYTRTDDTYPTLNERVEKANNLKADYFISIHCNGNDKHGVHGTETHIHSMGIKSSADLANSIESQFKDRAGRHSRGVKDQNDLKHSIQVLKYTNMTSVLVECGFLTNENEAQFLNTDEGQEIIASAIFRAFRGHIVKSHPDISFIPKEKEEKETPVATVDPEKPFAVQFMSSKDPIDQASSNFSHLGQDVKRHEISSNSVYKYIYTVGSFTSTEEAKTVLAEVKGKGYHDAFIRKL